MRAESLKGHLDALVLAVLKDEPAHGYAVIEQLKLRSDGAFDLPEGTVYPVLHRLEAEGLLSSSWSTVSGRKRRVYKLTRRGQGTLARQRDEWKSFANAVQAVLA
ncbi:MAG TPA: helix-turn-helix transcriptional regulator [Gaiellaceae bacterium]|jgi:DNA-binding PadR family transcriptional regulator|nr:helix-turn-helix transcriptional regulator [Gaiellaceae bacterium]